MTRYVTAAISMLMFAFGAWSQSSPPEHQVPAPDLIDGAVNPGLIPDTIAYRLYFITVSETRNAPPEARKRQLAYLSKVGLNENDLSSTISVLESFKSSYNELVARYNELAAAAEKEGKTPDYEMFVFKRDMLVQTTREDLHAVLSANGLASLDAFIKNEKRHMKIGLREVQP
jgi:hypothetical protein